MKESSKSLGETHSLEIAKELRLIRRSFYIAIALLLVIACGVYGLNFGEVLAVSFLAFIVFSLIVFIYRFKSYVAERRAWKEYSETPINHEANRTS